MLNILQSPISFPAINPFLISKTNIKHSPLKERLLSPIYGPTLLLLLAACHHNSSRTNRYEMENMLANAPQTILIEGSEGDDTDLSGTSGDDKYIASGGSDSIDGGAGDDMIYGGHSDDKLFGGTGADIIQADAGKDTLDGGDDDTVLMVLEDYRPALTFDDFALEVI